MLSLNQQHSLVALEFQKGNIVVQNSASEYAVMAIDQAHEQANVFIKGDDVAI